MTSSRPADSPPPGLRERKKARTRAAIQEHALRLFARQGYEATTVEQIAAAAEVSPSTFFRYFPAKEDVVISDDYDPLIMAAFRVQPPELTPLQAVRGAIRSVLGGLSAAEQAALRQRLLLATTSTLELRAAMLGNITQTAGMAATLLAERTGRAPTDHPVRILVGALLGVWLSVAVHWAAHPELDLATELDAAMATLEAGLPL